MEEKLSNKDKIDILFHEYDTLRSEIINRGNHLYQVFALGGLFFIWIVGHSVDVRFWISIIVATLLLSLAWWFVARDTGKAAERLRQLEQQINALAQDDLLIWETRWGGAVTGYWGRARPLPPPSRRAKNRASKHS